MYVCLAKSRPILTQRINKILLYIVVIVVFFWTCFAIYFFVYPFVYNNLPETKINTQYIPCSAPKYTVATTTRKGETPTDPGIRWNRYVRALHVGNILPSSIYGRNAFHNILYIPPHGSEYYEVSRTIHKEWKT